MTVKAGSLVWDLEVGQAAEINRSVDQLGRKLEQVLNRRTTGASPLRKVKEDADKSVSAVQQLTDRFARLKAEHDLGLRSSEAYGQSLNKIRTELQQAGQASNLTTREYRQLSTASGQVTRELGNLSREQDRAAESARKTATEQRRMADSEVRDRVRSLVNEVRVLRNEWQETGENTEETKLRLNSLMREMRELRTELRQGEDGWEEYNAEIARLATAGRSAQATIDGIEGRMSRLGLASQVNLGVLNALQGQLGRFGPAGQIAGQGLGIVAGGFTTMGTGAMLASGGVLALAATAGALTQRGIPEVKEMQAALQVLRASGEDLTAAELDEELRDLQEAAGSAGNLFRRAEIATALSEIVKAGVDTADAMHLMVPGMQLATVTGQSLNETTMLLLGNLRQFGMDTSQAARAADALAQADLAAAEGARELSEGLAIVGPVAAAAGFEFEDVLGILVELSNKGMSAADTGATALRGALSALLDPTAKAKDALAGLGVELTDGAGKRRPLLTVMQELRDALEGNSEAANIAAEIFDTRAITAIINMTKESDDLARALRNSGGALEGYADTITRENLQLAQRNLNTAVSDLALSFAGTFADDIVAATTALAGWFRTVDTWMQEPTLLRFIQMLDSNYEGWEDMTLGERLGTILGGDLLPERAPNYEYDLEAIRDRVDAARVEVERLEEERDGWKRWTRGAAASLQLDRDLVTAREELARATALLAQAEQQSLDLRDQERKAGRGTATGGTGGDAGDDNLDGVAQSVEALIARSRELHAQLSAAVSPREIYDANAAIQEFTGSSQEAARAWQAVNQALRGGGGDGATPRTVDAIFADLKDAGLQVREAAEAMGGGLEAELWSLEQRAKLVDGAIKELLARPDVNTGDNPDRLQYLLNRSEELSGSIATVQDQLDRLGRTPTPGGTIEGMVAAEVLGPSAGMSTGLSPEALRARLRATADRIREADQAVWDAYQEAMHDPARVQAMAAAEVSGPGAGMSTGLSQGAVRARLQQIKARLNAEFQAAWEAYQELMSDPARVAEMADAEVGGPSAGMDTGLSQGAVRARLRAVQARLDAEFSAAYAAYLEEMNDPARLQAMVDAEVGGPSAGMSTGLSPENLRARLRAARDRGIDPIEPDTIESLRRELIDLRNAGVEPTSAAVQVLVRRINELQLAAALEELREKGLKNISDFARGVLELNGLLPTTVSETRSFSDALRNLNTASTTGLANIIDGIKRITEAGGDAEEVIAGLTLALEGATALVEALGEGDAFEMVKAAAMVAGEAIGQAMGVPGVGGAVGALFDLGRVIVQSISDAFSGDSPAARAIREGLTPAVQSAFTNGILGALQGNAEWRENLGENVKLAFLTGLINAFVQSAIVNTLIEPILTKSSKLIARGQYEEAMAVIAAELPAAIRTGIEIAEGFISSLPSNLLPTVPPGPTPPGGSGGNAQPGPTGVFELPTAAVTGIAAPDWARDLVNAGRMQLDAAASFAQAVELLRSEGIYVRTDPGTPTPSGSAAAARAI